MTRGDRDWIDGYFEGLESGLKQKRRRKPSDFVSVGDILRKSFKLRGLI